MSDVEIHTPRFRLRPLREQDVSERYLAWLRDADAQRFIYAASTTRELDDLRRYVAARVGREDVLFLGIFDADSGDHVGNIKYEPLDSRLGYAVMGVLIGEPAYRGRGVTREVLEASAAWLKQHRGVREIVLGVDCDNAAAIRVYEKTGFRRAATPHIPQPKEGTLTMVWRL